MNEDQQDQSKEISFLLKSMKSEYLHDTMTKGKFCFNHPTVFSKWEDPSAAQYDPWDAHDAFAVRHIVAARIIGYKEGKPVYAPGKEIAPNGISHMQSNTVKHTPICCFRYIEPKEFVIKENGIEYSLGENADRILHEFGHDAYIIIPIKPFLERLKQRIGNYMAMAVVYRDVLNDYQFNVEEQYEEFVEQLFRKDAKYAWQKEYRIILPPTLISPVLVELGSIEDIASCGNIADLKY